METRQEIIVLEWKGFLKWWDDRKKFCEQESWSEGVLSSLSVCSINNDYSLWLLQQDFWLSIQVIWQWVSQSDAWQAIWSRKIIFKWWTASQWMETHEEELVSWSYNECQWWTASQGMEAQEEEFCLVLNGGKRISEYLCNFRIHIQEHILKEILWKCVQIDGYQRMRLKFWAGGKYESRGRERDKSFLWPCWLYIVLMAFKKFQIFSILQQTQFSVLTSVQLKVSCTGTYYAGRTRFKLYM